MFPFQTSTHATKLISDCSHQFMSWLPFWLKMCVEISRFHLCSHVSDYELYHMFSCACCSDGVLFFTTTCKLCCATETLRTAKLLVSSGLSPPKPLRVCSDNSNLQSEELAQGNLLNAELIIIITAGRVTEVNPFSV